MRTYFKFTASSIAATALDYALTIFLTEVVLVMYVLSSGIGLVSGGIMNYLVNKNWVFQRDEKWHMRTAVLYGIVWIVNLTMNTAGLYALTEFAAIDYRLSKVITAVVVGGLLSYSAQRKIVFRPQGAA